MTFSLEKKGDFQVLKVDQIQNELENKAILEAIDQALDDGSRQFVVDLTEMKFINSIGLRLLVAILTKSRNADGETYLMNPPEQISKVLIMTKLQSVFTFVDSLEEQVLDTQQAEF